MDTVDLIIQSATTFYNELKNDPNGRYRSWEYCYKNFHDARHNANADVDYLSLHLAFYLASWGMYRGSSFLLQKDYKIHIPAIKEILKPKYDALFDIDCSSIKRASNQNLLLEVGEWLSDYYDTIRKEVRETEPKNGLSNTLITKVLMGTLGCVPAYDRYFIAGVKDKNITTGIYNLKSLLKLADFYTHNLERLESARRTFTVYDLPYPQMKILDMGFWQIGYELESGRE